MPKKDKYETYFDDRNKHQIVEDFCLSWSNHTVWLRNEPVFVIDWSEIDAPFSSNRVIVVGNTAYSMSGQFDEWARKKKIPIKHGDVVSADWSFEMQAKGILYSGHPPPSIEWLDSIISRATPADDMPTVVEQLIEKYTDAIEIAEDVKIQVKKELYQKIMKLKIEGRVLGDFKLQPLRDQQIANLGSRIDNLEQRINNTDRMIQAINENLGQINASLLRMGPGSSQQGGRTGT